MPDPRPELMRGLTAMQGHADQLQAELQADLEQLDAREAELLKTDPDANGSELAELRRARRAVTDQLNAYADPDPSEDPA